MRRQRRGKRKLAKAVREGASYSPIQHLAYALFLNHDPRQRYFVMLTPYIAYFDASGSRSQGTMLIVAGYISCVEDWLHFETEWGKVLGQAGIKCFHMTDFIRGEGEFKNRKWKRQETQDKFLGKLVDITCKHVDYCPGAFVYLSDWREINKMFCLKESCHTPLALAGGMCVHMVYDWCRDHAINPNYVRFIFEDGDEDKGHLIKMIKTVYGFTPGFEKKALAPLQACDLVAWEANKAERKAIKNINGFRPSFQQIISRIKTDHIAFDATSLIRFCQKHNIEKRVEGPHE